MLSHPHKANQQTQGDTFISISLIHSDLCTNLHIDNSDIDHLQKFKFGLVNITMGIIK